MRLITSNGIDAVHPANSGVLLGDPSTLRHGLKPRIKPATFWLPCNRCVGLSDPWDNVFPVQVDLLGILSITLSVFKAINYNDIGVVSLNIIITGFENGQCFTLMAYLQRLHQSRNHLFIISFRNKRS